MSERGRAHIFVLGSVQGVFFRSDTAQKAKSLGLRGWVKNLSDGRVEAVFEGDEERIKEIIQWLKKGSTFAKVDRIEIERGEYRGEFQGFKIIY